MEHDGDTPTNPGYRRPRRPRIVMTRADVDWVKARGERERRCLYVMLVTVVVLVCHTMLLLREHTHEPPGGNGPAQVR